MTFVRLHKPSVAVRAPRGSFSHGFMHPVRIVMHCTQSPNKPGDVDVIAVIHDWMQQPRDERLGAHFIIDGAGNIGQCGTAHELLYHTGGLNTGSVGIEHVGFAEWTAKEWHSHPLQLEKSARLIAYLHHRFAIPIDHGEAFGCGDATAGVLTHAQVSKVCADSEGHTDPGEGFPLAFVLTRARTIVQANGWMRVR